MKEFDITKCADKELYKEFTSELNVLATYFYNQGIIDSLAISGNSTNPIHEKYIISVRRISAQLFHRYGVGDENEISGIKHKLELKAKECAGILLAKLGRGPVISDITSTILRIPESGIAPAR